MLEDECTRRVVYEGHEDISGKLSILSRELPLSRTSEYSVANMPLHYRLPEDLKEFDVIVSPIHSREYPYTNMIRLLAVCHGSKDLWLRDLTIHAGGLTGCVVAGRLAEADPNLKILLIEQGPNNYGHRDVIYPALYPRNLFPSSQYMLFWQTRKSPQLADRAPIVPSGGSLGGGSAVNWMVYTRAQRSDFDAWNTKGWGADEMLPFLKKVRIFRTSW